MKKITQIYKPKKFTLEIYLTSVCNFNCEYCKLHDIDAKFNKIDFDKLLSIDNENFDIYIFGGEPLIHPEIEQLISKLKGNIIIQTNLSISEEKLINLMKYNITINPSFHFKMANKNNFLNNMNILDSYNKLGDTSIMWISEYDKEISMFYKILKMKFKNVYLEPTLPWTFDRQDWIDKIELHKFSEKYSYDLSKGFSKTILVDGVEKTLLQSYLDNDDLFVKGINCSIKDYRLSYDAHLNKWRGCTADIIFKHNSEGICKNDFCLLDLAYEKYHYCNINT